MDNYKIDWDDYYIYPDEIKYFLNNASRILGEEWEVSPSPSHQVVHLGHFNHGLRFIKFSFIKKDPNHALDMLPTIISRDYP